MSAALQQLDAIAGHIDALRRRRRPRRPAVGPVHAAAPRCWPPCRRATARCFLNLLDRLESSALFSEESCSFSQKDLLDNLSLWVDKARAQLGG